MTKQYCINYALSISFRHIRNISQYLNWSYETNF